MKKPNVISLSGIILCCVSYNSFADDANSANYTNSRASKMQAKIQRLESENEWRREKLQETIDDCNNRALNSLPVSQSSSSSFDSVMADTNNLISAMQQGGNCNRMTDPAIDYNQRKIDNLSYQLTKLLYHN